MAESTSYRQALERLAEAALCGAARALLAIGVTVPNTVNQSVSIADGPAIVIDPRPSLAR